MPGPCSGSATAASDQRQHSPRRPRVRVFCADSPWPIREPQVYQKREYPGSPRTNPDARRSRPDVNAPASLPSSLPPNASCHAMRGAWPNRCALQPAGRARAIVAPRRTIVEGPRAKTERVPCPDLASMLASPREAMHGRYRRECRATGPLLFAERLMEKFPPYTHLPWLTLRLPTHPGQKQMFSTSIT